MRKTFLTKLLIAALAGFSFLTADAQVKKSVKKPARKQKTVKPVVPELARTANDTNITRVKITTSFGEMIVD